MTDMEKCTTYKRRGDKCTIACKLELDLDNVGVLCEECNMGKSNYDDFDYRNKLQERAVLPIILNQ